LARGEAVSSEIVNTTWRERLALPDLPEVTPQEAGVNLAGIAASVDLTFFAHYATDAAGHTNRMDHAVTALERVDAFLDGLVPALDPLSLLVLASDHGNIEDVTSGHKRNPTLSILVGPGAAELRTGLAKLTDLAGLILGYLSGHP
jgi:2,3-bisphosphoglycerate-independent phosphoglycerate mutase